MTMIVMKSPLHTLRKRLQTQRLFLANVLSSDNNSDHVGSLKNKLRKEKIIWHKNKAKVTNILRDDEE